MTESPLGLGIEGFDYADLYDPAALQRLTDRFHRVVAATDEELWQRFCQLRDEPRTSAAEASAVVMGVAEHLSRFVAELFRLPDYPAGSRSAAAVAATLHKFKRDFVMRGALRRHPHADPAEVDRLREAVDHLVGEVADRELGLAQCALRLLDEKAGRQACDSGEDASAGLDVLERWTAAAVQAQRQFGRFGDWVSLQLPDDLTQPDGLVHIVRPEPRIPQFVEGPEAALRRRDGFALTDQRWGARQVLDHTHYCLLCHERGKDSCSRGYPLPRRAEGVAQNALGVMLRGCPLEERISEAHALRRTGDVIAALAVVMMDNPMCPGTGHRICNDCMKACVYQKQDPVNIPQVETHTLTEVLSLPYGVEIYGLLTRWNPLNVHRPQALPYNGINVLVTGLGPAGYTLAHWLLNEGFGVVGIDGLKIEPLPADLLWNGDGPPRPIRDFTEIEEPLSERVTMGFGGVAEYGITVRWDKNFLKLIYLTLMRRQTMRVYGGVRFGGTLTIEDAWEVGFHHVAMAAGAGRPTVLKLKNNLLPGMRAASDFLMALQLTGAYKASSLASLTLRLPAVVIGGGLTGIDACTEALAYYPVQAEKTLECYEQVCADSGEQRVQASLTPEERELL
ncbi:MAG: pyridine nucleotide-disulfide oxidoreductase, partial [Chloroflexota bacterium]